MYTRPVIIFFIIINVKCPSLFLFRFSRNCFPFESFSRILMKIAHNSTNFADGLWCRKFPNSFRNQLSFHQRIH